MKKKGVMESFQHKHYLHKKGLEVKARSAPENFEISKPQKCDFQRSWD